MNDFKAQSKPYFANNPDVEVLYFTSDGQMFPELNRAENHASRLKDKGVIDIYHPDITKPEIKQRKAAYEAEQTQQRQEAYKSAFPELSALVAANARKQPRT